MSLEPDLPFEFVVCGTTVSLGASARSRTAWQAKIRAAARAALREGYWLLTRPLSVTVFIFPSTPLRGDIDNRLKPILDAMSTCIYADDAQVERLLIQKFEPGRVFTPAAPSEVMQLAAGLGETEPVVYIRVDEDLIEASS